MCMNETSRTYSSESANSSSRSPMLMVSEMCLLSSRSTMCLVRHWSNTIWSSDAVGLECCSGSQSQARVWSWQLYRGRHLSHSHVFHASRATCWYDVPDFRVSSLVRPLPGFQHQILLKDRVARGVCATMSV